VGGKWLLAALLFVRVLISPPSFADSTGTITGTITDPRGAVVPKANIAVRNEETNEVRDAESNDDGDYTQLASGPDGLVHAAWADTRDGVSMQIWSQTVLF